MFTVDVKQQYNNNNSASLEGPSKLSARKTITDPDIVELFLFLFFFYAGSPCNNYQGYCDVFYSCRGVDAEGPLTRLKNLIFSPTTLKTISDWIVVSTIYSILFYPITLKGCQGTTDDFTTIPFHLVLFSAALVELAKSIPVNSLIWSSHFFSVYLFFSFFLLLPCRIVFAKPEDLETWSNHLSFCFSTVSSE